MGETGVKTEEFKDSHFNIPSGWQLTTLGQISRIRRGASPRPIDSPEWFADEGFGWVRITDVTRSNGRLRTTEQRLSPKGVAKSVPVKPGQLIMSICATIGEPAIVEIDVCIHDGFVVFDEYENCLDTQFLYHFLRYWTPNFRGYGQTGTQANLNTDIVGATSILLPPKEEQRLIAEILDTIDSAIAHTTTLIAKLKQMKAGLLHDLLTRGLDENGELRDATQHPEQFKDSPLGQIPQEWEVVPIQQAASQVPGATTIGPFGSNLLASDYRSVGVPVTFVRDIKVDGFQWNSNIYVEPKKARELSEHSVQSGDFLATKMGLPPCIACVYPEWMTSGIITADIIRLRPDTQISTSQWLSLFVNSHAFIQQVRGIRGGITRDKITLYFFRKLLIALPKLEEQKQITNLLATYKTRIRTEEAYRDKLKLQKQGLMHDLLTGKVRVKNALN
ncbi:MAG: restriction endonuclease subunit S [Actinomycetota bacterium]